MTQPPRIPDIPDVPSDAPPSVRSFLGKVREVIQVREGRRGDDLDTTVTFRDLVQQGLAKLPAGSLPGSRRPGTPSIIPTAPANSDQATPDLTPPPAVTGLTVTALFSAFMVEWVTPNYTQGGGPAYVEVWAAPWAGTGPLPTFANAILVDRINGPIYVFPAELATQWHFWLRNVSKAGVPQVTPTGGINGVSSNLGRVGNSDLADDIIQARNLQNGSVTAAKVAAASLDATKFAASIEPVTIVVGSTVPLTRSTNTIYLTGDSKLYRWNGSAYTAAVATSDLLGTIADAQLAGIAASKITGQLSDAQLAAISAAKLTGQITSTQITDGAISTPKLAAGAVTAAQIAADTITAAQIAANAITSSELAAGAVVAGKIAAGTIQAADIAAGTITGDRIAANTIAADRLVANSITAGQVAAGAIGAAQIAAGAIRTDKLLVTGQGAALNADPNTQDVSAWAGGTFSVLVDSAAPTGRALEITSTGATTAEVAMYALDSSRNYQFRIHARQVSGASTCYLGIDFLDAAGVSILGATNATGWPSAGTFFYFGLLGTQPPGAYTQYSIAFGPGETAKIPANARYARIIILGNYTGSGSQRFSSIRLMEKASADLIVDGSIIASKLAANAIVAGSAAIQDGAITNAKIGNLAVDDAKIAGMSVAKLTAASLGVGQFIQSTNYVAGSSGWRINADGSAEFGAASIRGQLTASQIDSRGLSIRDGSGNIILAAGSPLAASNITPASNWLNGNITVSGGVLQGIGTAGVQVDNSVLALGQNLIPNSDQTSALTWGSGANFPHTTIISLQYASNIWGSGYTLQGGTTRNLTYQQGAPTGQGNGVPVVDFYPTGSWSRATAIQIVAGQRYCFSAYLLAHRCDVGVAFQFFDANDNATTGLIDSGPIGTTEGFADSLSSYVRPAVFWVAPAGSSLCRVVIRKYNTRVGQSESYIWMAAPQLEAVAANATAPSPYRAGPPASTRQLGYTGDLNATFGASGSVIGGANLTPNGGFERLNADGRPWNWGAYIPWLEATFTNGAGRAPGTRAARLICTQDVNRNNSWAFGIATTADGAAGIQGGWISGRAYTLSFWARAISANQRGMQLNWNFAPASTTWRQNPTLSGTWQRYEVTIVTGASIEGNGSFFITRQEPNLTRIGDELWIDDLQWQEGDFATQYTESVFDSVAASRPITSGNVGALVDVNAGLNNSQIGINASGQFYGGGAGTGITVSNNQILVGNDGRLTGIGTGSGTVVDNAKVGGDNLIPDPQFLSPNFWMGDWDGDPSITTFAAINAVRWTGNYAGSPGVALQCNGGGANNDVRGQRIILQRGRYRLRIRVYKDAAGTNGVFWAGIHVPGQAWWTSPPSNVPPSPENGWNLGAIPGNSWTDYTTTLDIPGIDSFICQPRIRNGLTSGAIWFTMELARVPSFDGTNEIGGQINSSNASTFIANAAIGNAQIANLAVGTLNIQGNAVTVPIGASLASNWSPGTALETTALTIGTLDTGGAPLFVIVSVAGRALGASFGNTNPVFRLRINGALIWQQSIVSVPSFETSAGMTRCAYIANPGSGSLSITLTVETGSGCTLTLFSSQEGGTSALALGCKR